MKLKTLGIYLFLAASLAAMYCYGRSDAETSVLKRCAGQGKIVLASGALNVTLNCNIDHVSP